VAVGVGVRVAVAVGVGVLVAVAVGVLVAVAVGVRVDVAVGVAVFDGREVAVGVDVGLSVIDACVGVRVAVAVGVRVGVTVGSPGLVAVGVAVGSEGESIVPVAVAPSVVAVAVVPSGTIDRAGAVTIAGDVAVESASVGLATASATMPVPVSVGSAWLARAVVDTVGVLSPAMAMTGSFESSSSPNRLAPLSRTPPTISATATPARMAIGILASVLPIPAIFGAIGFAAGGSVGADGDEAPSGLGAS
jgi:hypothetical protein